MRSCRTLITTLLAGAIVVAGCGATATTGTTTGATRVSKFCTSLAAMRPDLPANRWTRALHRPWVTGVTGLRLPAGEWAPSLAPSG